MPRHLTADDAERWKGVFEELVRVSVDAILHERNVHDAIAMDITDDEVRARGIVALNNRDGAPVPVPAKWNWGINRWIRPVRQEIAKRAEAQRRADADALLAARDDAGATVLAFLTVQPERFQDVLDGKHPGWMLAKDVFNDAECTRLRAMPTGPAVNLFNDVSLEPSARDANAMHAAITKMKTSKVRYRDMLNVIMPPKRKGWHAASTNMSAFRIQTQIGNDDDEEWILERIRARLPENAVFAPPGKRAYMIRNVRDAPRTASRGEQPLHYDFPPGLNRLGVIISLHDSVYLAVGDRWSNDLSKVCTRVNIPKGSVLIFANTVPHAGMGDTGVDGCERIHLYVGLDCAPEEVHPLGDDGELATFFVQPGDAPCMPCMHDAPRRQRRR